MCVNSSYDSQLRLQLRLRLRLQLQRRQFIFEISICLGFEYLVPTVPCALAYEQARFEGYPWLATWPAAGAALSGKGCHSS